MISVRYWTWEFHPEKAVLKSCLGSFWKFQSSIWILAMQIMGTLKDEIYSFVWSGFRSAPFNRPWRDLKSWQREHFEMFQKHYKSFEISDVTSKFTSRCLYYWSNVIIFILFATNSYILNLIAGIHKSVSSNKLYNKNIFIRTSAWSFRAIKYFFLNICLEFSNYIIKKCNFKIVDI